MMSEYKGYKIRIENDQDVESPREWDNLGMMVCFHRRYQLGDKKHGYTDPEHLMNELERVGDYIALPLYLYDHGDITMSTKPYACPWDSGQVGMIFVSDMRARQQLGEGYDRKKVEEILRQEVETYDQYLRGDVYWYSIEGPDGEVLDSCGGFFGQEYLETEIKAIIDAEVQRCQSV